MTNKPKKPPRRLSKFLRKYLEEEDGSEGKNNTVCSHGKHDVFAAIIKISESKAHFSSQKPPSGPSKFLERFLKEIEEEWSRDE